MLDKKSWNAFTSSMMPPLDYPKIAHIDPHFVIFRKMVYGLPVFHPFQPEQQIPYDDFACSL